MGDVQPRSDEVGGDALLLALDAIVAQDDAPSGFEGVLSFGVVEPGAPATSASWLVITCGARPGCRFQDSPERGSDAFLLVDAEVARGLLLSGKRRAGLFETLGDREVLSRFLSRYIQTQNLLLLRQRQSNGDQR